MLSDRKSTPLVNDTLAGHTTEHVDVFTASEEQTLWTCPFCESDSAYQLPLPPSSKPKKFSQIKTLIKEHVQLHQKEVVEELIEDNSFSNYEREKEKRAQSIRRWIQGTISDRGLYPHMQNE